MNLYYNLPPEQRRVQQNVALFNADEQLWESLEGKRRFRRRLFPRVSAKGQKQLDLLDFATARPLQDCVGQFEEP
ncbi:MAG TPA: hypothetical protein VGW77_19840 [Candidatus Binatia bacterium]|jgi:hypothetical protein|nr:hypothetical protein [Candidatus Binatia bacterium]